MALAVMGAACTLGLALQISDGTLHPDALKGVGGTLALSGFGVLAARVGRWNALAERALLACLLLALVSQLQPWFSSEAGQHLAIADPWRYAPLYLGLSLEMLAAGILLGSPNDLRRWLIPLLAASFVPVGLFMIKARPTPNIDVWIFQDDGARALLRGENPYGITFHNVFGSPIYYGEGMVKDGRLLFGFPYPPLSLYFATLGSLFGDPRYAHFACITLAATLMAYMRKGRLAAGAAALFLLTPRGLLVLEMGWTEPFVVFLLAVSVFCALRYPRALPYAFGFLLAVKQYTIFMVPLVVLITPLRGRALLGFLLRAAIVGLVLTLPLFLINPNAFLWSVVKLQFHQPFRMDALSYLPWWVNRGHPQPPIWVPFAATGLAILVSLWRAARTPAGFAAAVAFVYCTFFAFNKQAFCNYYYLVVGALCIALAAHHGPEPKEAS